MRTQEEVTALVGTLERMNDALFEQVRDAEFDCDAASEQVAAFNHNGHLICALKWVLGEDTIKVGEQAAVDA